MPDCVGLYSNFTGFFFIWERAIDSLKLLILVKIPASNLDSILFYYNLEYAISILTVKFFIILEHDSFKKQLKVMILEGPSLLNIH